MKQVIYSGTTLSPGMSCGKAFVISTGRLEGLPYTPIRDEEVHSEVEKLWVAVEISISELQGIIRRVKDQIGERESKVFEVHTMMLRDRRLTARMTDRIDFEKISAETAVARTILEIIQSFRGHGEELKAKFASDLRDLGLRLIKNLSPFFTYDKTQDLEDPVIIVARELTPSVVIRLDRQKVLGFVCEWGDRTTHAGILVRSMGVPAIAGVQDFFQIKNGDHISLDGREGKVMINPGGKALEIFEKSYKEYQSVIHEPEKLTDVPARTQDGQPIQFLANIWMPGDLEMVQAIGAQGIGLVRTEFAYLFRNKPPREEDLYQYFRGMLERIEGSNTVNIRLLDVGGEMELPAGLFQEHPQKLYGLKYLLEEKELLKVQLRALLRASAVGPIRIVYPFFDSLDDLLSANKILLALRKEMQDEKIRIQEGMEVGVLVETPEIIDQIEPLLKQVSFVILGSNDLALRLLGLDRRSKIELSGFRFISGAFLKRTKEVLTACERLKKDFYFSGNMAEDPHYLALLIGMGIRNFNLSGSSIPKIKEWLASVNVTELCRLFDQALSIKDDETLRKMLIKNWRDHEK